MSLSDLWYLVVLISDPKQIAGGNKKGIHSVKQKVVEWDEMYPPVHKSKGPVTVNGKVASKGK